MNNQWEIIKVGMVRGEWSGFPDGIAMDWADGFGLVAKIFCNKPNDKEKRDFAAGSRFEIAFKDIDGIGFFAMKFGEQEWMDCYFSPNLYDKIPKFDKNKNGNAYKLHLMFIDSSNGKLEEIRTISLGAEFAEYFRKWCIKSLERNIGLVYYNRIIDKAIKDYPDAAKIAEKADIRWVRPHGEEMKNEEREREKIREEQ